MLVEKISLLLNVEKERERIREREKDNFLRLRQRVFFISYRIYLYGVFKRIDYNGNK